jgi:hypothetical protein
MLRPVDQQKATDGYSYLQQVPVGQKLFAMADFDNLYLAWDGQDAIDAQNATPDQRRKIAYARYGFVDAPYPNNGLPMGLIYNSTTNGVHMNCLLCHGGSIRGTSIPGLANQRLDLATFFEDLTVLAFMAQKQTPPPRPINLPGVFVSTNYSKTRGGSNSWIATANLLASRTADLNPITPTPPLGTWQDFDTTPPPYWNIKKKSRFYHAGNITINPRSPSLGLLDDKSLAAAQLTGPLPDFENVLNWFDSLSAPPYPGPIDANLAAAGKIVFNNTCAQCHGTYGNQWTYPDKDVPIATVGTDAVDLNGKGSFLQNYFLSWYNQFGAVDSQAGLNRQSYVAPPLDGIWASAPYLHNGSVPTLYGILHPDQRPAIWKVTDFDGYDDANMGLQVQGYAASPVTPAMTASEQRTYFDSSVYGQSNQGHMFANVLTEDQKTEVLEYLKTL